MATLGLVPTKVSEVSSESSRHSGRSFSRTLTISSAESYSGVIPENLSFEELTNIVEYLQQVVRQLELENEIFQAFLVYHDPSLIADMDDTLGAMTAALHKIESRDRRRETLDTEESTEEGETPQKSEDILSFEEEDGMIVVNYQIPSELARMVNVPSTISIRQTKSSSVGSNSFLRERLSSVIRRRIALSFERCPRMNYAQRLDVSYWATEQQQDRLKAAVERAKSVGALLRAQIEAMGLRITETRNMLIYFNAKFNVFLFNEDKPLSAEYFVKDIRGTVLYLDATMERLRLKMGGLKLHQKKVLADLAAKRELRESIRPVDIETVKIQNEQLMRSIALKTKHLNEVKTISGHATQKVNSNKKRLAELTTKLKSLRTEVQVKRNYIAKMEQEEKPVVQEAQKAERALKNIRERIAKFTAPDVLEYVRQKRDIRNLRKQIASLTRRYALQSQTTSDLRSRLKYLTQGKARHYSSMSLKESSLKPDKRLRRNRSYLPGKGAILETCLGGIYECYAPLDCPPLPLGPSEPTLQSRDPKPAKTT